CDHSLDPFAKFGEPADNLGGRHIRTAVIQTGDGDLRVQLVVPVTGALAHEKLSGCRIELPPVTVVTRGALGTQDDRKGTVFGDREVVELGSDRLEAHVPLGPLEAAHHLRRALSDLDETV